jgi:hypothetical protein
MAAPVPVIWAADNVGWPIYAEADAAGNQERLQMDGTDVVDAAGIVYPVNADGCPMDGPGATANEIPQPNIAVRQRQWMMDQAAMAAAAHAATAAGTAPATGPPIILPVAIAPPAPGMIPAPAFALNPGQVAMATTIDYTSSEGQRMFREGSKPLFGESNKFGLTADRIQPFLQSLKARGNLNGWDFSVNVGTPLTATYKNLVDSYGEIPLQRIQETVENEIQGLSTRRRQTDNMMHVCILASLTEQATAVVFLKINEYKAPNGEDSGLLLLKLVISESTLETKSTVNHMWGKLTTGLPGIMAGHSNNIQLFNRDVKSIQGDLRARGENPDNIVPQLFSTYYNCEGTNSPLGRFIEFLENSYNAGTALTSAELMYKVEEKYKELKERQLVQGPKKDDEIVALKAELEAMKKSPKRAGNDSGNSDAKQKKTKWMFVRPKDGEPKTKKVNDKDYHWCDGKDDAHKPKWVRHHPSDCGRREPTAAGATDGANPPAVPTPAPAPAPTASSTNPPWTTVMMATLSDHE